MQNIKIAVIGVGVMGKNHARIYSEIPDCELVAVSDLEEKKAKEIADEFSNLVANYQGIAAQMQSRSNKLFGISYEEFGPVREGTIGGTFIVFNAALAKRLMEHENSVSKKLREHLHR